MKKRKLYTALVLVAAGIAAAACGAKSDESDNTVMEQSDLQFIIPEISDDGNVLVDTSSITEHPKYVNYDADGTTIQLIVVKVSDGSSRLSLNTCQACNPSPMAYFKEENGRLVCQNCGNVFTMDSIGSIAGGCNPMNIEYEDTGDFLIVKATDLNAYVDTFTSWKGPTK